MIGSDGSDPSKESADPPSSDVGSEPLDHDQAKCVILEDQIGNTEKYSQHRKRRSHGRKTISERTMPAGMAISPVTRMALSMIPAVISSATRWASLMKAGSCRHFRITSIFLEKGRATCLFLRMREVEGTLDASEGDGEMERSRDPPAGGEELLSI